MYLLKYLSEGIQPEVKSTPSINRTAISFRYRLYRFANITVQSFRFAHVDCRLQAIARCVNKALRVGVYLSDRIRAVEIRMEAFVVERDIEIDDVTLLQGSLIWYA